MRNKLPKAPPEVERQRKLNGDDPSWRGDPEGPRYYSFYKGKAELPEEHRKYDHDWGHILAACEMIKERDHEDPMCCYLPIGFPHPTYRVEEPWYSMIDRSKVRPRVPAPEDTSKWPSMLRGIVERQHLQGLPDEIWTDMRATYYGMIARVDHQYGMLVDALKEAGIYDDTAIFIFSDHGDFVGDYGIAEKNQNTFQDCLSRVPFMIKPPKDVPVKPRVVDGLTELVDFPATVYEMTGIEPGYTHFGHSLLPQIAGETDENRDAVFCEGGRMHGERHCMETQSNSSFDPTGQYWPRVNLQQSEGPEHTKAVMCRTDRYKYVRRLYELDELYDLETDPHELNNRIDDPELSRVVAELKERMLTFFMETGDVVPFEEDQR